MPTGPPCISPDYSGSGAAAWPEGDEQVREKDACGQWCDAPSGEPAIDLLDRERDDVVNERQVVQSRHTRDPLSLGKCPQAVACHSDDLVAGGRTLNSRSVRQRVPLQAVRQADMLDDESQIIDKQGSGERRL